MRRHALATPADRVRSAVIVAAIHVALGYALLTGLGVTPVPALPDPVLPLFDIAPEPEPEPTPPPAPEPAVAAQAAPPQQETIRVETIPQASNAAARLLEIATRNADELVDDAKAQADRIVGEARTKAERLESESKVKADRLESDARTRSQMLDSETAERRQQLFGDLEKERDKLNGDVETLRQFEREYRSRLKTYFTQQLEALSTGGDSPVPVDSGHGPKRLRSVLGDDEG